MTCHRQSVRVNPCATTIRSSMVSGYTVAYATCGPSDLVKSPANASAGGSVVLPAMRPLRVV